MPVKLLSVVCMQLAHAIPRFIVVDKIIIAIITVTDLQLLTVTLHGFGET